MAKLSEKSPTRVHRVCAYGPPKTGKTELAGRLAEHFNLIFFDLENGHDVLFKLPREWQERIEIISIPDTRTFPVAIETMLKVVTGAKISICDKHGKSACMLCIKEGAPQTTVELANTPQDTIVVIDSLTQLSNSAMSYICKNQPEDFKPGWEEYRTQGTLMDKFLSQIQQAPYNVVCVTHETEVELEDKSKKVVPVAGSANFSRNTAKYFDEVVYARVANKRHNFYSSTTAINDILTGSRTGVVLEGTEQPTLLSIFKPEAAPKNAPSLAADTVGTAPKNPGVAAVGNLANALAKLKVGTGKP